MIVYLSSSGKGRSSFLLGVDPVHHHNQDDDDGDDGGDKDLDNCDDGDPRSKGPNGGSNATEEQEEKYDFRVICAHFDRALRLSRLLLTILVFEMLLLPGPLRPPMGGKMQYLDIGS